ncbi:Transposase [Oopsacas minuta]|uniref:Transposase n=1 Tax=Oopsacas minuta TaxID=111878 RepID=A0AAV7JGY7_9METZ|nr:Transposase [Oopsacas minuta]
MFFILYLYDIGKHSKIEQRAYVKIRTLLGKSAHEIHLDLVQVYTTKGALSYAGVRRWAQRFRLGRKSIEDDPQPGAPIMVASPIKSCAIKKLIDLDSHITIRELSKSVGISMGSVDHILRSQLKLTKVCARWAPHLLTKAQKETRVGCCRNLLKSYKECDPRRLFEIVTVAQVIIPKGQTVTGSFYTSNCLGAVGENLSKRRKRTGAKGLRLLHDNARPHKTKQVKEKILRMGITELEHPPYSPDLAPCDFYLFPKLKEYLSGRHFSNSIELGSAIFQYLKRIPPEDYKNILYNGWSVFNAV